MRRRLLKLQAQRFTILRALWLLAGCFTAAALLSLYDSGPLQTAQASQTDTRHAGQALQGVFRDSRPRTVYGGEEPVQRIRARYRQDASFRDKVDAWTQGASKWLCAKDRSAGKDAIQSLLESQISLPRASGSYGNGRYLALRYDFLFDHPDWTPLYTFRAWHKMYNLEPRLTYEHYPDCPSSSCLY